jgi:hypothetical protein
MHRIDHSIIFQDTRHFWAKWPKAVKTLTPGGAGVPDIRRKNRYWHEIKNKTRLCDSLFKACLPRSNSLDAERLCSLAAVHQLVQRSLSPEHTQVRSLYPGRNFCPRLRTSVCINTILLSAFTVLGTEFPTYICRKQFVIVSSWVQNFLPR